MNNNKEFVSSILRIDKYFIYLRICVRSNSTLPNNDSFFFFISMSILVRFYMKGEKNNNNPL